LADLLIIWLWLTFWATLDGLAAGVGAMSINECHKHVAFPFCKHVCVFAVDCKNCSWQLYVV